MSAAEVAAWYDEYLATFRMLARGESDDYEALLEYYAIPTIVTVDVDSFALATIDQARPMLEGQMRALRDARYDDSEVTSFRHLAVATGACLLRTNFTRRATDGSVIARLRAAYWIVHGDNGTRIHALAISTPAP